VALAATVLVHVPGGDAAVPEMARGPRRGEKRQRISLRNGVELPELPTGRTKAVGPRHGRRS
jgi:hypothetical protein